MEYFRDKAIVVGSGPSVRSPIGKYIDMFESVVRVNGFDLADVRATGQRTTHVFLHSLTAGSESLKIALTRVPRERRLLFTLGKSLQLVNKRMLTPGRVELTVDNTTILGEYYHHGLMREVFQAKYGTTTPFLRSQKRPLTGTVAVAWCLRNIKARPIYIIGCDMTLGSGVRDMTYLKANYVSRITRKRRSRHGHLRDIEKYHDVPSEIAYLSTLAAMDEIAQLDELPWIAALPLSPP